MPATKICKKCGNEKPVKEFYPTTYRSRKTGELSRQALCILCYTARSRDYYASSPEKRKAQSERTALAAEKRRKANPQAWALARRRAHLKNVYGVDVEEWDALLIAQSGRCGICSVALMGDIKPNLDHDHVDGSIRGLLCPDCNKGLGVFKDSPDNLLNAVSYLWSSPRLRKEGVGREEVMPS